MKLFTLLSLLGTVMLLLSSCGEKHHDGDGHDHGAEKHTEGDGHKH